jgi:hypothetical protein
MSAMGEQPPQDPYQPYQGQPGQDQPYQGQPGQDQPYQGQPFGPPPGSQPAYYGGYNPPGWQPPRRRRKHAVRGGLIGLGILVVIAVVGIAVGRTGSKSPAVQVSVPTISVPTISVAPIGAGSKLAEVPVGSAVTLTGISTAEKLAVTAVTVFSHPRPASDLDAVDQGDRLYAVQFRLHNTGSTAYSDAPELGATVLDADGRSYKASFDNVAGCTSFPAGVNIAAGQSSQGCIVLEVPANARITLVQFTLDAGLGPQTGQWKVSS